MPRSFRFALGNQLLALAVALATIQTTSLLGRAQESTKNSRPNIIVIMPDDQGWGDHGFTGNELVSTPNIDQLAADSAQMTEFYVSPVCSPTRAALMTGRYNYRTRIVDTYQGRSMMDSEEVTLAEFLQKAGYRTGIFGKWHLGDCYPMRPQDQGFDEVLIHRGGGLAQPSEPLENERRYTDPILWHNGEQVQADGYCTDVYFEGAKSFIKKCADEDEPFFVYLPTNAPHGPFHDVPAEKLEKYKQLDLTPLMINDNNEDRLARVFAMVENIDDNIGELRELLAELEIEDNTIVVYLVDNGPNTRRYVGSMRGMKTEVHDGGIRSPFLVSWPGHLKPGTTSDRIAAHIDIAPTLLEAAGVNVPADHPFDGRSLLPLLKADEDAPANWTDRTLVLQSHRGNQPVPFHHCAVRTQQYKLVHPSGFGREQMPDDVPFELYDMQADLGESNNLASTKPEIVAELKAAYLEWFEDVSSTRENNYAPPWIHIGNEAETHTALTRQDWRVEETEGWGRGGVWNVVVEQEGPYDIKVIWNRDVPAGEVQLMANGVKVASIKTESSVNKLSFGAVRLPLGKLKLTAHSTSPNPDDQSKQQQFDPYQIEVIQNPR